MVFYIVIVGWILSVCLHEYAHARVAYHGGDTSVAEKGYLTFNPLRYTDPVWSIVMPLVFLALGGIGLPGGAVYINHRLLRSRSWETAVSLAGPAANLVVAIVLGGLFSTGVVKVDTSNPLSCALAFLVELQVSALILNLLPIPPLDGFQAIAPWLPGDWRERLMGMSGFFTFLLFIILWNYGPANQWFWAAIKFLTRELGASPELAQWGWREFQFWRR